MASQGRVATSSKRKICGPGGITAATLYAIVAATAASIGRRFTRQLDGLTSRRAAGVFLQHGVSDVPVQGRVAATGQRAIDHGLREPAGGRRHPRRSLRKHLGRQTLGQEQLERPSPSEWVGDDRTDLPPGACPLMASSTLMIGTVQSGAPPAVPSSQPGGREARRRQGRQRSPCVAVVAAVEAEHDLGAIRDRAGIRAVGPRLGRAATPRKGPLAG
jgi:hypothetical protein